MDNNIISTNENKVLLSDKKAHNLAISQASGQGEFFHKKTQKIVTAIYLVTNFLSEDNPLRRSLRQSSMELLSLIGSIIFSTHPDPKKAGSEIRFHSNQIVSALSIAVYSGYISEMNYKILEREFEMYLNESSPLFTALNDNFKLPDFGSIVADTQDKKQGQKNDFKNKDKGQNVPIANTNKGGPVYIRKKSRKDTIIAVLQKKDSATIKDISEVISNCSEKTIQRELLSLVKDGILKKSGERRWSTYSLV